MATIKEYTIKPEHLVDYITKKSDEVTSPEDATGQKMLGISDEVLNVYYKTAWKFLEEGNWADARDAFLFLVFLNPFVHDFWTCLGIAEQSQSKFNEALVAYTMAEATNPDNPVPIANAFQCSSALGEEVYAKYALEKAIEKCGDLPEHKDLKEKLLKFRH